MTGRPVNPAVTQAAANFVALTSAAGEALLNRLAGLEVDSAGELRLAERLRREYPPELVTAALAQHELRRLARGKFRLADRMFFTRDGLEQASAEPVARHRAARFATAEPRRIADLCCGIGGDLIALAGIDPDADVRAVDRDPVHARMAEYNAGVYSAVDQAPGRARSECADVRQIDLGGLDAVFVDPARRANGRRLRAGDSEPPLDWCVTLAERVPLVGIKAAPGLDRAAVPPAWEVEFVADGRDLKEAVLWSPALADGVRGRATVLPGGDQLAASSTDADRSSEPQAKPPGEYLLDPNPAVTRAGLVGELARRLDAWQIDPQIAFLSSDRPMRTPFGRGLRVLDSGPWREKELPGRLRALGIGALDIRRRGLAGDVAALSRRLRGKLDGAGRPGVLVMTRLNDRPWALICVPQP